jgi:hypothetical protein
MRSGARDGKIKLRPATLEVYRHRQRNSSCVRPRNHRHKHLRWAALILLLGGDISRSDMDLRV